MGQGLLDSDPVFREHLERGLERARTRHGLDLRAWLLPADTDLPRAAAELERPSLQVPLLFITEYALAQSWLARGITPAALIGHSLGENTAACVAGVMDFDTTLGLAALRGRLFESLPPGGMLSVPLPAAELRLLLPEGVVVACENAPSLCVASGPRASIDALAQELATRELEVQPIRIQIAAHSPMLEPILAEFEAYLRRAKLSAPKLPIISNLTGQPLTAAEATDPTYWVRQLRNTVRFAAGIETLESAGPRIYLEVGPGRALGQLVRQCLHSGQARAERTPISSLRHPDEAVDDAAFQLAALGRLWASGAPVDLAPVLPKNARRVRLPTYAFDHQPYFIAEKASEAPAAVSAARAALDDWFYAPVWQPRVLDDNQLDPTESQTYLLFADDLGIADRLAQQLRAAGHRPIFVRKSEAYGQTDLLEYEVSPGASHSYETLVQELTASEKLPTRIVHLWGVNAEAEPSDTWVYDSARRTATFDSLFHLLRALTAEGVTTPMQLTIVTSGAQRLLTEPLPHPEKALVQGLCAVMPHEAPHLTLRWVDVPPPRRAGVLSRLRGAPPDDAAALVRDLEREARARDAHTTVAYRGGQRFERDLLPTPLTAAESARSLLRTEGVYMITGGLGGIGLTLAEALVREHRARVCLVARRRLPERVEWERLVTSPRTKPELARTLLALLALEQLGADYTVITADVADHEQMQRAFDHAQARFGSVHGVFHAAGVLEDRLLARKTREEAERVLSPKLDGTWVLHQLAQRHGVELLVLFGSTSSWLGAPGQSDYAAANAFLEAYTQSRRGQPGPHTITIQWGVWRDVGMAVNAAARGDHPTPAAGSGGAAVALPPRGTPSTDAATEPREVRPQSDVRELAGARGPEERLPRSQGHARSHRDGFFDDAAAQSAADGSLVLSGEHNAEQAWWLDEHRMLDGTAVMPGTGYLQLMAAAWQRLDQARPVEIRQAAFLRPLAVIDNASASVRVQLRPEAGGFSCEITSHAPGNEPEIHASAQLMPLYEEDPKPLDLDQIRARCQLRVQREPDGITTAQEAHLRFGPRFRSLRAMYVGDREALGELALDPRFTRDVDTTPLHAGLLDIGTGFALPIVPGYDPEQGLWAPLSYTRLALHAPLPARCAAWVRVHERAHATQPTIAFDVTLTDEEGRVCVVVEGLTVRKLPRGESLSTRVEVPERSAARPARAWDELAVEQNLALGISAREGLQALSRIVRGGAPAHVMVSPRNPYALRHALSRPEAAADSGGARFARPELSSEYVAPSDPLHVELASMWQALLGVEGIGIRDDFFELGGHSLTAVRLSSAVKKQLGVELGLATLFEAPTIERMAELLAGDVNLAPAAPHETGDATAAASGNVKSVNRREFTPLVPIKPRGEQRPLFCAAGQGGNPMHLRTLAHYLGAQRPFYGLQHRGLDGHSHPYASVEEMASDYVRHIMQVESGPYLIAGYSGGGTAAFEMARQLRAAGQQVEALILLDSFCPLDPEPGLAWRLRAHLTGLRSEGVAYARRRVAVRLRDKRRQLERKLLGQPNVSGQSRSMFETAAANWQNIEDRYAAKPLDERAYLFRVENPSTDDARYFERRYNGWNQLLRAGVQQVIVPGTHVSMCEEPNVQTLAQRVREVLDALDDASRAAQ
ncbi:MAG: SDR family NAD(P)-dependent oxidoreductase [Polyangiales bacterium]